MHLKMSQKTAMQATISSQRDRSKAQVMLEKMSTISLDSLMVY